MLYVQVVTTSAKNVLKQEYTEVNQIVHAQMVNTSYQIKLVVIVQFNVTLVKFQVLSDSCRGIRKSTPDCGCPDEFFDPRNDDGECFVCEYQCDTCSGTSSDCITCS